MDNNRGKSSMFLLSSLCVGGSERKIIRVANALYRRGRRAHIAYLNGPETLLTELDPGIPRVCLERHGKFSPAAVARLVNYVRQHDVSRIVCVNLYPLLYALSTAALVRQSGLSCVALVNTTDFLSVKEKYSMMLYSPLLKRVSRVVFGCAFQMSQWIQRYRLPAEKCGYIYNGVDETHYSRVSLNAPRQEIRASIGLSDDDFVIGTVGQLRPEKRQSDLIEAVSRLRAKGKNVKALIVGAGKEKDNLERLVQERGLKDKVLFLGEVKDPRPALAAMDVFVLTSVAVETFSNAALEAMSMGVPVVLSDIAGAREMVRDGVNGCLYPKGDVDVLFGVLAALISDAATVTRLGREARAQVIEKFSFSQMLNQYEALLSAT
jgi:glycosyltransferase involved in cell wall biosynthesis